MLLGRDGKIEIFMVNLLKSHRRVKGFCGQN